MQLLIHAFAPDWMRFLVATAEGQRKKRQELPFSHSAASCRMRIWIGLAPTQNPRRSGETDMITRRRLARSTAAMALTGLLAACVSMSTYDQLNQQLSGEIAAGQVHITRLQGAIKVAVNSELLFPSGGWNMPPQAAKTIAEMAPILAPQQTAHILVTGYTDNVPIGPDLRQQGITSNQQLSLMRAQTVMNYLISQGVNPNLVSAQGLGDSDPIASNDTAQGRAQNRRVELTLTGTSG